MREFLAYTVVNWSLAFGERTDRFVSVVFVNLYPNHRANAISTGVQKLIYGRDVTQKR